MARLPQPGSDNGAWGDILNEYLTQIHTDGGFLKDGIVEEAQLSTAVQTKLNATGGLIVANDITDATATGKSILTATNVASVRTIAGLGSVDNTSDANKPISTATQTALNAKAATSSLATVATSGDYNDLSNKPAFSSAVSSVNTQTGAVVIDADDISDATTTKKFTTAADITKLSGVQAGAQVNNISNGDATDLTDNGDSSLHYHSADRNRTNHTGTQTASTISDFNTATDARVVNGITAERTVSTAYTNKDFTSGTNTFPTFNQNTTGSAATLTTSRTVQTNLASTSTASFNGSTNITPGVTGTLPVGNGGTGATTLTGMVKGNGTSAFTVATAGTDYITPTGTETLTNKRVTPRVVTTASNATPAIDTDTTNVFGLTALTVDVTSFTTNLTGTPTDGQRLWIYVVGTATRNLGWGSSFEAGSIPLPLTTIGTTRLDIGFVWNTTTSKWRCVAVA